MSPQNLPQAKVPGAVVAARTQTAGHRAKVGHLHVMVQVADEGATLPLPIPPRAGRFCDAAFFDEQLEFFCELRVVPPQLIGWFTDPLPNSLYFYLA